MTSTELLNDKIKTSGLRKAFIAEKIGCSRASLANKIYNKHEFKASEIHLLAELLELSAPEMQRIFFASDVVK